MPVLPSEPIAHVADQLVEWKCFQERFEFPMKIWVLPRELNNLVDDRRYHKLICLHAGASLASDELLLLGQVRKHPHLK